MKCLFDLTKGEKMLDLMMLMILVQIFAIFIHAHNKGEFYYFHLISNSNPIAHTLNYLSKSKRGRLLALRGLYNPHVLIFDK